MLRVKHSVGMQPAFRSTSRGLSSRHLFLDGFAPVIFWLSQQNYPLQPTATVTALLFLTPSRVGMQTPVFGLPVPFARGALHVPVPAPASHTAPQQRWFIFCPQHWVNADEAQTEQTRSLCTFSSQKTDPDHFPITASAFSFPTPGAVGANLLPTAPVGADPIPHQGWEVRT